MTESSQAVRAEAGFFLALGRSELRLYLLGFVLIFVANIGEIAWVRVTAHAVEAVTRGESSVGYALAMIAIAILVCGFKWSNRMASFLAARRIERRIRARAFRSAIGMSQDRLDHHRTGDLVSRIINDVSDIRMVLGSGFLQLTNNLFAYATTLIAMLLLEPRLAVAALLPFVPLVFIAQRLNAVNYARSKRSQEALGSLSAAVEETVGGVEVLKSYNALGWQNDRFAIVNGRAYAAEIARSIPESLFVGLMGSVVWVGIAAIILAAGWIISVDALHSNIPIGDITTFIFLFAKLVWPTVALGWIMNVIQRGFAAASRLQPFLGDDTDAVETRRSLLRAARPATIGGDTSLIFERVSYRYPTRDAGTLHDIELAIPAGQWVGIVGPTASGKTTLARLACGLRTPTTGRLLIGGRDLAAMDDDERRHVVHLATQTPTLFSRSIADNLQLAGSGLETEGDLRALLEDSAFGEELAEMPEGLATPIGERGLLLSGGQRQRLSLARALLCNPDVLILDDILSAVDLTTELKLLDGILHRRTRRTTLFITHRFRVLARLERVLVVEAGRIVADGTLTEALQASTWLRDAYEADRLRATLSTEDRAAGAGGIS